MHRAERDTHSGGRERGSAILAAMIMVAVFAAVLTLAVERNKPAKKQKELKAQAKIRIQALSRVIANYYKENGAFPNELSEVVGKGRVDTELLKDPFAKGEELKYKILRQNPDVAMLYSIGPNRKDDGGKKGDIRRRFSGKRIGMAETKDRLRLIRRALIGKTGTGSGLGEKDLDATRSSFLALLDRYWATSKAYANPASNIQGGNWQQWAQRWSHIWGGIAIYLAAYLGAYSYQLSTDGNNPFLNSSSFFKKPAPQLLVHSLLYSSIMSSFFSFNQTSDPSLIQADIDSLKALGLPAAKENVYLAAMETFRDLTQHVFDGGSLSDTQGRTLLANGFDNARKKAITAMLSSQTGQDQTTTDFLSSFSTLEGRNGLIQALGLPSKFAYDAWGVPFQIDKSGGRPRIRSAGPDRKTGTKDDRTMRRKTPRRKKPNSSK